GMMPAGDMKSQSMTSQISRWSSARNFWRTSERQYLRRHARLWHSSALSQAHGISMRLFEAGSDSGTQTTRSNIFFKSGCALFTSRFSSSRASGSERSTKLSITWATPAARSLRRERFTLNIVSPIAWIDGLRDIDKAPVARTCDSAAAQHGG